MSKKQLKRIADALERIAFALETKSTVYVSPWTTTTTPTIQKPIVTYSTNGSN